MPSINQFEILSSAFPETLLASVALNSARVALVPIPQPDRVHRLRVDVARTTSQQGVSLSVRRDRGTNQERSIKDVIARYRPLAPVAGHASRDKDEAARLFLAQSYPGRRRLYVSLYSVTIWNDAA
jgi:hypothetical protein